MFRLIFFRSGLVKRYFLSNKILENLWQVGGEDLTAPGDAAIYLVRLGDEAALVDAGCGTGHEQLVKNISACLPAHVNIIYLFLTHCHYDHTGGAEAVRRRYSCKIVAHELDATFLEKADDSVTAARWYRTQMRPLKIDYKISAEKEIIKVGNSDIKAYHCPGHSPGSLVYTAELDSKKVIFGQDVHGPLHPTLLSNRQDYQCCLQFILSLKADILCEGHFGIFRGKKEIDQFVRSFL